MPIFVNEIEISDEAVFAEMQYHSAQSADDAIEKAGRALVIKNLLLSRAKELDIIIPDAIDDEIIEEDYLISRVLEEDVKTPEPDDVSCLTYYNSNQNIFKDKAGKFVAFEYVKPTIAAFLKDVSWQTAVSQYLQILIGRSDIRGIDLIGADSPLIGAR